MYVLKYKNRLTFYKIKSAFNVSNSAVLNSPNAELINKRDEFIS